MQTAKKDEAKELAARRAARREHRRSAREKLARLRANLKEALATRKVRMRELTATCRAQRLSVREQLREMLRKGRLAITERAEAERAAVKEDCAAKKKRAKETCESAIALARAELAAERQRVKAERRIQRDERARHVALERAHGAGASLHAVRSAMLGHFGPLYERVRPAHVSAGESRAEAVLRYAERHPEEAHALVHPKAEQAIAQVKAEIAAVERAMEAPRADDTTRARAPRKAKKSAAEASNAVPAPRRGLRLVATNTPAKDSVKAPELRDTADIAKRIRADISAAVKAKKLPAAKYSVRTEKYSMGSTITVEASKLPFPVINPDAFVVHKGASHVTFDGSHYRSRLLIKAQEVERTLNAIVDAYHWDRSDHATDYYNERFHKDVRITEDGGAFRKMEAEKVAAARAVET